MLCNVTHISKLRKKVSMIITYRGYYAFHSTKENSAIINPFLASTKYIYIRIYTTVLTLPYYVTS